MICAVGVSCVQVEKKNEKEGDETEQCRKARLHDPTAQLQLHYSTRNTANLATYHEEARIRRGNDISAAKIIQ